MNELMKHLTKGALHTHISFMYTRPSILSLLSQSITSQIPIFQLSVY